MGENSRETELVLTPNEYAYYLDATKGNVNVVVGPYKQSLSGTDQPVVWAEGHKKFMNVPQNDAKKQNLVIPEGWYAPLKNPAKLKEHPQAGTISDQNAAGLEIGKKVNIPGPASFALWPGQMAEVIQGHSLRSNQYLVVRVYDVDAFRRELEIDKVTPKTKGDGDGEVENVETDLVKARNVDIYDGLDLETLTTGQQFVIKGTDVHFYIPPTGAEVVRLPDAKNKGKGFVQNAVTLEQLQYCILQDEDGNKEYVKGPAVVFPKPTQWFIENKKADNPYALLAKKFKAIELDEKSGIYVKVIKEYKEGDVRHKVGEELFIRGTEQMIYFPREEHAIIKYAGGGDKQFAVAIPAGEGRYVMSRKTGKIRIEKGPSVFLPDPREEVIVRRVLDVKTVKLMFPGNEEALKHNLQLQKVVKGDKDHIPEAVLNQLSESLSRGDANFMQAMYSTSMTDVVGEAVMGDQFDRKDTFTPPRTVTLDTKYEGVVVVNVWNGYAVMVVDRQGNRRVVEGPETILMEYDEALESMSLSTGKPKTTDKPLETVYLRTKNNVVSDLVRVETKDLCQAEVRLSYRVDFEGDDPLKWFDVENYVKFLCDHARSMIKNAVKQISVREFYANGIEIVRDIVLGKKGDGDGRPGLAFGENGMRVYDVEIFNIKIANEKLANELNARASRALHDALDLEEAQRQLEKSKELELIGVERVRVENEAKRSKAGLTLETAKVEIETDIERIRLIAEQRVEVHKSELAAEAEKLAVTEEEKKRHMVQFSTEIEQATERAKLVINKLKDELEIEKGRMEAESKKATAIGKAIDPQFTAALAALGTNDLVAKLAEAIGPMSIFEDDDVIELLKARFGSLGLDHVFDRLAESFGRTLGDDPEDE